jgi:hypothetical protein
MKKLAIFGMVVLMLAFGAGLALANPQVATDDGSGNLSNNPFIADGNSGSVNTGIGDVAEGGSTQSITENKTFDNSKNLTVDGNSLSVTKTDSDIKNINADNGNSITVTKSDTDTKNITVDKSKSLTIGVGDVALGVENEAEKGSAAATNGNASVTKDSNNTKGSGNTKNITADNGNSTTVTKSKTITIDKSGQNNSKNIIKDISGGSAAAINGNALVDHSKTWNIVDNQVLWATNSGNAASGALSTGTATQNVTKTFTASNSGTFTNINGVINNNNMAGNCNNASALTTISVGGNVTGP